MGLLVSTLQLDATTNKFSIFDNQRIAKPAGMRSFSRDEFKIDLERIEKRRDGHNYGSQESLLELGNYFLEDVDGKTAWSQLASNALRCLNDWDVRRKGFGEKRFIYALYSSLEPLSIVYQYTGHHELGMLLKAHLLQAATLPFEFWLHSELRGFNPRKPTGGLETATLAAAYSNALQFSQGLLNADETKICREALYRKGLIPSLNWLDNLRRSNWTAVIATGAFVTAKYFNDKPGMAKALEGMKYYLSNAIEDDGSYGEGTSYFSYPIGTLLKGILCMSKSQRNEVFGHSGLRASSEWIVYNYFFKTDSHGRTSTTGTHFSDNSFRIQPNSVVNIILASMYDSGLPVWILDKFKVNHQKDWRLKLLALSDAGKLPAPCSPREMKLPLVRSFDNGDNFIRSGWGDNSTVLALRSGNGAKINYAHQRPELNSICMGAYGEYLVVSAGSASYRSPIHYTWDRTTRGANTVSIDDQNQLFPGSGKTTWANVDISGIWQSGKPEARIVQCHGGTIADILVSEANQAYHVPMNRARRAVLYVRKPGYFIMVDRLEAEDAAHKYTWRMHFNNRDQKAALTAIDPGNFLLTRPNVSMTVFVSSANDLKTEIGKGYMHGKSRDYSPGGKYEGELGSSIELAAFNAEKTKDLTIVSVMYPFKKGMAHPDKITQSASGIQIGDDRAALQEGILTLNTQNATEVFKLW
jgi:hypothetical protein